MCSLRRNFRKTDNSGRGFKVDAELGVDTVI
jgi:hypothetical protein